MENEAPWQQALFIEEVFTRTDTSDFVGSVRYTAPVRFTGGPWISMLATRSLRPLPI